MTNEIIIYQSDDLSEKLEVRIEDETVWLTQNQMVELFQSTKQNISLHISNIYKEKELSSDATVKEYLTVQKEGNRNVKRKLKFYNLDVIISVGYRVKSIRGTQFRIWANKVLKDYLLKGYSVSKRIDRIEEDIHYLKEKTKAFDLEIKANLLLAQGIFFDGQVFDAYVFVIDLIKTAQKSILLIDNYIDESVLTMLSKRNPKVSANIYTNNITQSLKLDLQKHNSQYPDITIRKYKKTHDRFLILDEKEVYHIGASLKDLGKKWFAFSKIKFDAKEIIERLNQL